MVDAKYQGLILVGVPNTLTKVAASLEGHGSFCTFWPTKNQKWIKKVLFRELYV